MKNIPNYLIASIKSKVVAFHEEEQNLTIEQKIGWIRYLCKTPEELVVFKAIYNSLYPLAQDDFISQEVDQKFNDEVLKKTIEEKKQQMVDIYQETFNDCQENREFEQSATTIKSKDPPKTIIKTGLFKRGSISFVSANEIESEKKKINTSNQNYSSYEQRRLDEYNKRVKLRAQRNYMNNFEQ